jgi:hypothetical protein
MGCAVLSPELGLGEDWTFSGTSRIWPGRPNASRNGSQCNPFQGGSQGSVTRRIRVALVELTLHLP